MLTIDYVVEHFDEFKMPFTAEDHGDEIGHSDLFYSAMTVFGVSVYPFTEENVINETTQAPESEAEFSGFTMKFGNTPFLVDCTSARSASRHWMTSRRF